MFRKTRKLAMQFYHTLIDTLNTQLFLSSFLAFPFIFPFIIGDYNCPFTVLLSSLPFISPLILLSFGMHTLNAYMHVLIPTCLVPPRFLQLPLHLSNTTLYLYKLSLFVSVPSRITIYLRFHTYSHLTGIPVLLSHPPPLSPDSDPGSYSAPPSHRSAQLTHPEPISQPGPPRPHPSSPDLWPSMLPFTICTLHSAHNITQIKRLQGGFY